MEYALFLAVGLLSSAYAECETRYCLMHYAMRHDLLHKVCWLENKQKPFKFFLTV